MNPSRHEPHPAQGLTPQQCAKLLIRYWPRWVLLMLGCILVAAGYAAVMPRYWEASQALVVRSEVSTPGSSSPGKFADLYEMRSFQETILELVKSQHVISATLQAVAGAPPEVEPTAPQARELEDFRQRLQMSPPQGAEFGKTEVFYLQVQDEQPERAIQLVAELCRQLDSRLRQLRQEQARSLEAELQEQVKLAASTHDQETAKLTAFEISVGSDLGELRTLNASYSGQSDLRQRVTALEEATLQAGQQVRDAEHLVRELQRASQDPQQLVALPNSLLLSQPTLRQLKDGLVDAQLRAARLVGTHTSTHPAVTAADQAVQKIRGDLHAELQVAIQGLQIEVGLSKNRWSNLSQQTTRATERLHRLAVLRAPYANHVSAAENSRQVLDQARKQLGEVRAALASAREVSLVRPLDAPETGTHPVGLSRAAVVLLGAVGGCILGLGCLFLSVPPPGEPPAVSTATAERSSTWPADGCAAEVESNMPAAAPPAAPPATSDTPSHAFPVTAAAQHAVGQTLPIQLTPDGSVDAAPNVAALIAEITAAVSSEMGLPAEEQPTQSTPSGPRLFNRPPAKK